MGYEIDFLPVGEESRSGDAILLRYGDLYGTRDSQVVVLIDGGFKDTAEKVKSHLLEYYQTDRIDLVVSTHPDSDHINGLEPILEEVAVGELWMHLASRWSGPIQEAIKKVANHAYAEGVNRSLESAANLEDIARRKGIPIREPFTGLSDHSGSLFVAGPTEEFYANVFGEEGAKDDTQSGLLRWLGDSLKEMVFRVAEDWDIETLNDEGETSPTNNSSVILLFEWEGRKNLFTADAGIPALSDAADTLDERGFNPADLRLVQVPHHGSHRNVGPTILDRLLGPRLAVEVEGRTAIVSVAKEGAPEHPAKKVTNAFRRRGSPVHVTQGGVKWFNFETPERGWGASVPLPLFDEVDE